MFFYTKCIFWVAAMLVMVLGLGCEGDTTEEGTSEVISVKLTVTPKEAFAPQGVQGGPFEPAAREYSVEVEGGAISWEASADEDWVTVEPDSGTTDPGSSTRVQVSLTGAAAQLLPGVYEAQITFANSNNSSDSILIEVTLTVLAGGNLWVQTNGPGGGFIQAIMAANGILIAGSASAGIFRSTDEGDSWVAANNGLISKDIQALLFHTVSGKIYAGTGDTGAYVSEDNGLTWNQINNGLTNLDIRAFALHLPAGDLYAATFGGGVFALTNARASSWVDVNSGLTDFDIEALAMDNANDQLYAGTDDSGVFVCDTGSHNWDPYNTNLSNLNIEALVVNGQVYAGTDGGGVFASPKGSANWSAMNTDLTDLQIEELVLDSNGNLFAGTRFGGIFEYPNGGSQWAAKNSGLQDLQVESLIIDTGTGNLYVGTDAGGGVFRSTNGAADWASKNEGLVNTEIEALASHPDGELFAGTTLQGSGMFRTNDNGANWTAIDSGLTNRAIEAIAVYPSGELYIGTDGGGIFKSMNKGDSWAVENSGLGNMVVEALAVHPLNGKIFAGTDNGVFSADNNPVNWSDLSSGLTNPNVEALVFHPTTGDAYAGTTGDGVFTLPNGGSTWMPFNDGLGNLDIEALAVDPQTGELYAGTEGGAFRFPDGGATWQAINSGLTNDEVKSLLVHPISHKVFAGTNGGGIFTLQQGANSWQGFSDGLSNFTIEAFAVQNISGDVFAGTSGDGVFRNVQAGTLVVASGDFSGTGAKGGPFSPTSKSYRLTASGGFVQWQASANVTWVDLSQHHATLLSGESTQVEVSWNTVAENLDVGNYMGTLSFANINNNQGTTSRDLQLDIIPQPSTIAVQPDTGFMTSGQAGAFSPGSQLYFVTVGTGEHVRFNVTDSNNVNWLNVVPTSGTASTTQQVQVAVELNSNADALAPGTYNTNLFFNNIDDSGDKVARAVEVNVYAADTLLVTPNTPFNASGSAGGPFNDIQSYNLTSTGTNVDWKVAANVDWLTASVSASTTPATAQISINDNAYVLPPDTYNATLEFTNLTNGNGNTTRNVVLNVATSSAIMSVTPTSAFAASGISGGPFNDTKQYFIDNSSSSSYISWQVHPSANWLTVFPASGIATSTPSVVTVSVNSNADAFAPGNYDTLINFTNATNGQGNTSIDATLQVQTTLTTMGVTPDTAFSASGERGGPYTDTKDYIIQTAGDTIQWQVTSTVPWLTASPASGTASGTATTTTIYINDYANELTPNLYNAQLNFVNATTGEGNTARDVELTVTDSTATLTLTPADDFSVSGPQGGPFGDTRNYNISSNGNNIDWQATPEKPWVSVFPLAGTATSTPSIVTISINDAAESLTPGNYGSKVDFVNLFSGIGNTDRTVNLEVTDSVFWQTTTAPETGTIEVVFAPATQNNIYLGTEGGVFRSSNNGDSWQNVNSGLMDPFTEALGLDPSGRLYAGFDYLGVFRSLDNGDNWQRAINNGLDPDEDELRHIAIDTSGNIVIGTNSRALYRSTDQGDNWNLLNGYSPSGIEAIAFSPLNEYLYVGFDWNMNGSGGIQRSTDDGSTWMPLHTIVANGLATTVTQVGEVAYGNERFAVSDEVNDTLTIIDANGYFELASIPVQSFPRGVAFGNDLFAVANSNSATVSIIDATNDSFVANVNVGVNPIDIAYGNERFAVSNFASNTVTIIDANTYTIRDTLPVSAGPGSIAYGNNRFAVVSNSLEEVTLIDASNDSVITEIEVGGGPTQIAFGNDSFAVVNTTSNTVSLIDAVNDSWLVDVAVGDTPLDIAFGNDRFAVANSNSDTVTIIDAVNDVVMANVNVNGGSQHVAFGNNRFAVVRPGAFELVVIDATTNTIIDNNVGSISGRDIAFGNKRFFVAGNSNSLILNGFASGFNQVNAHAIEIDPQSGVIFAAAGGTPDAGLFRSTNDGVTWEVVNSGMSTDLFIENVAIAPGRGSMYTFAWDYNNEQFQWYSSTNSGDNWTIASSPGNYYIDDMAVNSSGYIFAGTVSNGVFRSTDGANSWETVNTGLIGVSVTDVRANSNGDLFASTFAAGIFKSTDHGTTWTQTNQGLGDLETDALIVTPDNTLFVSTEDHEVYRSTDDGVTWEYKSIGLSGDYVLALFAHPTIANLILAGVDGDLIYYSTDNGENWVNSTLSGPISAESFAYQSTTGYLYAGFDDAGVYSSTNNGVDWEAKNTGITGTLIEAIAINSSGHIIIGDAFGSGVYISQNNGTSWAAAGALPNSYIADLFVVPNPPQEDTIYVATFGSGVYRSVDNGANWTEVSSGLPSRITYSLGINANGNLLTGTAGGWIARSSQPVR